MPSPHYLSLNVIKIHFCHQKEQGCHHKGVSMCVFVCVCLNIKQHQFIWQFCKSRTNRTNHHEFIKCEGAFWYFFFFFCMCILFTLQITQAACGDNYDNNNKYADKMQKKTNIAHQSTPGKLIGKQGEVHRSIPRVQKGDMTMVVKDGASAETQWLTQSTAIKNHGEEREIPVWVFHKR